MRFCNVVARCRLLGALLITLSGCRTITHERLRLLRVQPTTEASNLGSGREVVVLQPFEDARSHLDYCGVTRSDHAQRCPRKHMGAWAAQVLTAYLTHAGFKTVSPGQERLQEAMYIDGRLEQLLATEVVGIQGEEVVTAFRLRVWIHTRGQLLAERVFSVKGTNRKHLHWDGYEFQESLQDAANELMSEVVYSVADLMDHPQDFLDSPERPAEGAASPSPLASRVPAQPTDDDDDPPDLLEGRGMLSLTSEHGRPPGPVEHASIEPSGYTIQLWGTFGSSPLAAGLGYGWMRLAARPGERAVQLRYPHLFLRYVPGWRHARPFAEASAGYGPIWEHSPGFWNDTEDEESRFLFHTFYYGARLGMEVDIAALRDDPIQRFGLVLLLGLAHHRTTAVYGVRYAEPPETHLESTNERRPIALWSPFLGLGLLYDTRPRH